MSADEADTTDTAAALDEVWQRAQTSGAYEFRTLIDQTIYPAPSLRNAGRPPQQDKVGMAGAINAYAQSFTMTLWRNATFDPAQGVKMKVENGRSYARTGLSEWEEVSGVTEGFAPAGDPLNFLGGITDVQQGEDTTFALGPSMKPSLPTNLPSTAPNWAAYVRRLLEHQLQEAANFPPVCSWVS